MSLQSTTYIAPRASSATPGAPVTADFGYKVWGCYYNGADVGSRVAVTVPIGGGSVSTTAPSTPGTYTWRGYDAQIGGNVVIESSPITVTASSSGSEAITLNDPGSQEPGASFTVMGSIANKPTSPSIQILLGGTALSGTATLSGSNFNYLVPGQSVGTLAIQAKDTSTGVTSNTVNVPVAAQSGGGVSGPPIPAGSLPTFQLQARSAIPTGSPITFGQLFARGDLPGVDLQAVTATVSGGQTIVFQGDQSNAWSVLDGGTADNSVRYASFSGFTTADIAAGATLTFQLAAAGSVTSGSGLTPTQFAALCDFKLQVGAGPLGNNSEYGSDTFTVSVNDILANFQQYNSSTGFGTNPLGGWRYTRKGPFCTEFEVWRMLKRDSDGASHRWVKCKLWARAWKLPGGGYHFECLPSLRQDQPFANGHPSATVGATTQGRHCGMAALYNDSTPLAYYGGPNDPRTVHTDQSAFNTGAGTMVNAAAIAWLWDQSDVVSWGGVPFCVSGSGTPSGLTQNRVYFLDAAKQVETSRSQAMNYNGGTTVGLGSAGSGSLTITPVMATYPSDGWMGPLPDASIPWVGNGGAARPTYMIGHNTSYLLRNTKCLPTWRLDLNVPNYTDFSGTNTFSLNRPPVRQDIEQYGDNNADNRIGYLHRHQINLLLNPLDRSREVRVLQQGFGYAEFDMWASDSATGMMVNGSLNTLGPMRSNSSYVSKLDAPGQGSPAWAGFDPSQDCWDWQYGSPMSAAHLPFYMPVPLLRTGHACFQELMEQCGNSMINGQFDRNSKGADLTNVMIDYYQLNSNIRSGGWGLRTLGCADRMCEDASPTRALTRLNLQQQSHYGALWNPPDAGTAALGLPYYGAGPYGGGNKQFSPFMDGHYFQGLSVEILVGDYDWSGILSKYWGPIDNLSNNLDYFLTNEYHIMLTNPSGTYYTSLAAAYAGAVQGSNTSYPGVTPKATSNIAYDMNYGEAVDFQHVGTDPDIPGIPATILAGPILATWIEPEFHNCRSVVASVMTRITTSPFKGFKYDGFDHLSGETDCFPMWAIAPHGQ